jgi:hypothetical protein
MAQVKSVRETVLNTPKKKLGYQISDGTRGTRDVIQLSGMADVSESWKEWKRRGLGDTISVQRGERFKRSFDLTEFGIEVPPVLQMATAQPPTTPASVEKSEPGQTELIGS